MANTVRVRRAKHMTAGLPRNRNRPHNWKVEEDTAIGTRVFVYSTYHYAIFNAQRLARHQVIFTYGLQGFHVIED